MNRPIQLSLLLIFLVISNSAMGQSKKYTRRIFGEKHELEQLKKEAEDNLDKSAVECKGVYRAVPANKWVCKSMSDYPNKYVCEVEYTCIRHGICMPGDRDVSGCVSEDVPENGIKYRTCLSDGSAWGQWGECKLAHCPMGKVMSQGKCIAISQQQAPEEKWEEQKRDIKPPKREEDRFSWKNASLAGINIKNSQGSLLTTDFAWTPMYITDEAIFRLNIGGHLFKQLEGSTEKVYNVIDMQLLTGKILPLNFYVEVGLGLQWWIGEEDKYFDVIAGGGYLFNKEIKYIDRIFVDVSAVLALHFTYEIKFGLGFKF